MLSDPSFWAAVAFFGFIALLIYLKAPAMVGKALDDRADGIRNELEDAQRLREEAQALLAEYQRKQRDAEKEAESILVQAKAEAESLAEESKAKLSEMLERRTKLAEDKIAQAEVQALKDVRAAAADLAVTAAHTLIAEQTKGKVAAGLIDGSIEELKTKLN